MGMQLGDRKFRMGMRFGGVCSIRCNRERGGNMWRGAEMGVRNLGTDNGAGIKGQVGDAERSAQDVAPILLVPGEPHGGFGAQWLM